MTDRWYGHDSASMTIAKSQCWLAVVMTHRRKSAAGAIWLGALGVVAVSILFAPIVTGGWCADAPAGGTSICGSFQRSVVGIDSNIWLWLAATAGIVCVTFVVARGRRRLSQ